MEQQQWWWQRQGTDWFTVQSIWILCTSGDQRQPARNVRRATYASTWSATHSAGLGWTGSADPASRSRKIAVDRMMEQSAIYKKAQRTMAGLKSEPTAETATTRAGIIGVLGEVTSGISRFESLIIKNRRGSPGPVQLNPQGPQQHKPLQQKYRSPRPLPPAPAHQHQLFLTFHVHVTG